MVCQKYFHEIKTGKYKKGECRFCGEKYVTNAVRMENQLLKCKRCLLAGKELCKKNPQKSESSSKHKNGKKNYRTEGEPVACSSSSLTLSNRQSHADSFSAAEDDDNATSEMETSNCDTSDTNDEAPDLHHVQ